ncbi:MAG TPA: FAD-dependent oxidoreductase [Terriglobia bacterium]|nr:FAD-dependent oxidoreductase [Terriglobia bacterium]
MDAATEVLAAGHRNAASRPSEGAAPPRERLVIVGNGMASYKLCEKLAARQGMARYEVVVVGEEPRPAYDRVHLTDFLAGRPEEELCLQSRAWYSANGITLRTGDRVIAIDRETRIAHTESGRWLAYDKLVFATGSRPFVPPVEGADLSDVFVYRTIGDLNEIRTRARNATSAAVIGGGLLGLEAARALQGLGLECHVVEFAPQLLPVQLDPRAGELARRQIEEMGLRVHVNVRVNRIAADGRRRSLHFADKDQEPISVDLVVVAAGIRPRQELAESCELAIAIPGGIQINDRLETSDPSIYAIGECANHRGVTYGLAAPAYQMAEVLVDRLLGGGAEFRGADMSTRLKVLGLDVSVFGDYNQPAVTHCWESDGVYRRIVVRDNRLVGASALGAWPEAGEVQDAVRVERRVWTWQARRFMRQGTLWPARRQPVGQWPAAATVCNCMNVSRGMLAAAQTAGCATVEAMAAATGASTLCGTCKPLLAELAGQPAATTGPARGARGLAVAAGAALLLVAAIFFAPSLPYAASVQTFPYDVIWRNSVWKQVTGFSLLGLTGLGMLLSARKRLRSFTRGDFGLWRAVHALLGVGALIVLVAHTGLRFGANLNAALMTVFALANLAGAAAGGVVSADHRLATTRAMALRKCVVWGHVVLVWPLPALVAFHILSAYYF